MYFNKFSHILLGLHYSFEPPHGGGNTGRNLFLRQRFSRSRPPTTVRMTGFYLEKKEDIHVQLRTLFRRQKPPSVMV
ncbi:Hypothetical protein FKW44_017423 [Caligus rogercresseyi]|uniref:Uncharacterized protein n=1 Tax=Caligus rogercresseyi TaxID=217165 RepID=A0A7T8JW43_CALRO|nr:Hypothetical protein FKW44_017423 [Caligus rogercresseyi]